MRDELALAKAEQAVGIQNELGIDVWLLFVRETDEIADPALRLVFRGNVVWPAALLYARDGRRTAIVGRFDVGGLPEGLFDRIVPYDQGIGEPLRQELANLDPRTIAINVSRDDVTADGLTAGMREVLGEALAGTPFSGRLMSSENLLARLRGRKLPMEVARIRRAAAITEEIIWDVLDRETREGETEISIYNRFHAAMAARGVGSAWADAHNPSVDAGPDKAIGHVGPTENRVKSGHLLHVDFGVRYEGYCADLQRMVFFGPMKKVPPEITRALETVAGAIRAASAALRPGVRGRDVDEVARRYVVERGYPEYMHALGHQIGQSAHDGGVLLGPPWERYGKTVEGLVEEGNVFTLELYAPAAGYGCVSLEEDVLVTKAGCEFLSKQQDQMHSVVLGRTSAALG